MQTVSETLVGLANGKHVQDIGKQEGERIQGISHPPSLPLVMSPTVTVSLVALAVLTRFTVTLVSTK